MYSQNLYYKMNKHILSLDIPETLNTKILRVTDTSVYASDLTVACPKLQVLTPGSIEEVTLDFNTNVENILTACDLGLQLTDCNTTLTDLPDGVYTIRYSVAPNDKVFVEYVHLRMSAALKLYYEILCTINLSGCEPLKEQKDKLNTLRLYKTMLDGAKAKVEYCHNVEVGVAIYNYVYSKLQKLSCTYCN